MTAADDLDDDDGYHTTPAYRAHLAQCLGIPAHVTTQLRYDVPLQHAFV